MDTLSTSELSILSHSDSNQTEMTPLLKFVKNHMPVSLTTFFNDNMHIIQAISNYLDMDSGCKRKDRYNKNVSNIITPRIENIFSAFYLISFDPHGLYDNSIKVILLFQDTYPTPGAACGIALATMNNKIQPSLKNFYDRIQDTYFPEVINQDNEKTKIKCDDLKNGDIRGWCTQGVLMLNSALTTRENETESHMSEWALFTTQFIRYLSDNFPYLVFALFGKKAQSYKKYINSTKHTLIETSHPSGRGIQYGFSKCDIFNEINDNLIANLRQPIRWENYSYV